MLHINLDRCSWLYHTENYQNDRKSRLNDLINEDKIFLLNENSVVFSIVYENYTWSLIDKNMIPDVYDILKDFNIKKVYWILNDVAQDQHEFKNIENLIFIDFFALKTYYYTIMKGLPYNTKWNSESEMGLYLPGKLLKYHRIGLLYFLYKDKLLDKCNYSSYFIDEMQDEAKKIIFELDNNSDINFDDFFLKCNNKLDKILMQVYKDNLTSHYSGFPYDVSLFQNSVISLISETNFPNQHIWMTEKTYRTIVNKHPFLMLGPSYTNRHLNEKGFKTFEKYMVHKFYDSYDNNTKINLVSDNFGHFLKTFSNYKTEINSDVEYNFNRFISFCEEEINKINLFLDYSLEMENLIYEMNGGKTC